MLAEAIWDAFLDLKKAHYSKGSTADSHGTARAGVMELRIVFLQHDLAFWLGEAAPPEPFLDLDRPKARLGEVDPHNGPEAASGRTPRGAGTEAMDADPVDGAEFLHLFGRRSWFEKGRRIPRMEVGVWAASTARFSGFCTTRSAPMFLKGSAHRLLIGRRDRIDRDEEGDAYGDAEDIHQASADGDGEAR